MPIRFRDSHSYLARSAVTLANYTSALSGTFVNAANRTGVINTTLAALPTAILGTHSFAQNRTGAIVTTLGNATSAIFGSLTGIAPVWQSGTITLSMNVGVPFSIDLDTLCTGAATYSLLSGSLPAGLTLSGDTISGTPTTVQSTTPTIRASDASIVPGWTSNPVL